MTTKTTKPARRAQPSMATRQPSLLLPISGSEAIDDRASAPSTDVSTAPTGASLISETPSRVQETPLVNLMRFDAPMTQIIARPFEVWFRWQADMLKAAEPLTIGWLERRREAANSALETIGKLARCGDLNEAASMQHEWFDGAMKRLTSDIAALTDHAMALSREAVAATRGATQTSSEASAPSKPRPGQKEAPVDAAA